MEPITLSLIATLLGITGGALAISEQILKWKREWDKTRRNTEQKTTLTVTITDKDGKQVVYTINSVEEATSVIHDITDLSKNLPQND